MHPEIIVIFSHTVLILYRTGNVQSAILSSFVVSSSLPPCGLQSTHPLISVTRFFFSLRVPNQCYQITKNRQSMRIFENCLKSCKVVTEFFWWVVGEGAEIFILLCHLAEQLLCVDSDFRSFQKRFVNFSTCSLKIFVVHSSIELQFFCSFFQFLD